VLTADLVRARKKGGELVLQALDKKARERALALAAEVVGAVEMHVGATREELDEALKAVEARASDQKLKAGLVKLALDRCELDGTAAEDAAELRREVFTRAAAHRRELAAGERFDRARVLAEVAAARGTPPEDLERALYGDLREAQVLRGFAKAAPEALVADWERGQVQAVLLRAVKLVVEVRCGSAAAARALFARLKFNRLLFTVERVPVEGAEEGGTFRLTIDGPMSLFDAVTKYGLQLANAFPAFEACDRWALAAELRWGNDREPLLFRAEGGAAREGRAEAPVLRDDVAALMEAVERADSGWKAKPAEAVLDLPGAGLCVPDLVLTKGKTKVFVEVMGFWSRDAVWRRVELVEKGLAEAVVFCVSSRLRVSEEVLPDDAPAALYVYKGTINARALLDRAAAVAARRK
jgi:hypothetical protein